jgi:glutamine amidotransferase
MCRFLAVHDKRPFAIGGHLRQLARIAAGSAEYQGDGWGCAWLEGGQWRAYRNLRPIWEDHLDRPEATTLLLAHARSAFRDEGPDVANNMPFVDGRAAFVFNGELRGVRVRAAGRIGAEKLFHLLLRLGGSRGETGVRKTVEAVRKRSRYVRAMNFVLAGPDAMFIHCCFNEAPGYFTLHKKLEGTRTLVCSEAYPGETGWDPLPNDHLEVHPF